MSDQGIGASVRRKEDFRFLTGAGNYTDDINRPGQLYAYILRSPHAHAEIAGIETANASGAPGVVAVFTSADMQVGGLPCGWLVTPKTARRWWNRHTQCLPRARCVTSATRWRS
jgi:carbon-monoxide dehydrogenase large subunit